MFIDFGRMRFKNLISYGNKWSEIDFSKGLNLIKAPNGSGKSSILDALNFVLFGKPFRNIKINQLINKHNNKNLVVELDFKTNNNVEYKLTRGLKPNIFTLVRNGSELDTLSSKKLNQEELEKILGINERLFKNIVGIAVTNNKPFLSMSQMEKRNLVENIFNIDVLSEMAKEVKKRNSLNKSDERIHIGEFSSLKERIKDNESNLKKIKKYIEEFDLNKQNNLENIRTKVIKINSDIDVIKSNISKCEEFIELNPIKTEKPDDSLYADIKSKIAVCNYEEKRIKKTLKELDNKSTCPLCSGSLTEGDASVHIKELKNKIKELKVEREDKLNQLDSLDEQIEKFNKEESNLKTIESRLSDENNKLKQKLKELENLKENYINEKDKTCSLEDGGEEERIKELNKKLENINLILEDLKEKISVDNKLVDILGDEGLRMFFFMKLLPILNQRINYYLEKFELSITLEFNAILENKIMNGQYEQNYNQFSTGEKSRIDMAILLSFFDISKIISNWSCSILFIDEVMDTGVDSSGSEQFLSTLHNIVTEENKNLCIYVISHKLAEVEINWSGVLEIQKKSIFSEIKII